jgi:hypothetical protein
VVAERDDVGPGVEELVGVLGVDPDAARGVLPVDHDEVGAELGPEAREQRAHRAPPGGADDVPDEQDRGQDRHGSRPP